MAAVPKGLPCPFLAEDGRCTVYEVRPRDCAEYPHTQKKGFPTARTAMLGMPSAAGRVLDR